MSTIAAAPEQEGPALTDERGELSYQYLSCAKCKWLRINDYHYFYCRDLGNKDLPDFTSVYTSGMKRLYCYPRPDRACAFLHGRDPCADFPKTQQPTK